MSIVYRDNILPPLAGEVAEHREAEGGIATKLQGDLGKSSICSPLPSPPPQAEEGNGRVGRIWRAWRKLQALIFALFFANPLFAQFATLDWTVAETLIALGEKPQAVGDAKSYQIWVGEPALPSDTLDLGVRLQPNPEQILSLAQSGKSLTFINSSFYAQATPTLEKFSRVEQVDFYREGDAWQNVVDATLKVGALIGKPEQAEKLMATFSQKIAEIRPLVATHIDRPIALVQFADSRHLRIYGKNSPFGAILSQLGFENVWQGEVNLWGTASIEVAQLAKLPSNSRLVVIKPYPANIKTSLDHNTLWQRLELARDPLILPAIWTFGGVPSAQRFAEAFAKALQNGGEQW